MFRSRSRRARSTPALSLAPAAPFGETPPLSPAERDDLADAATARSDERSAVRREVCATVLVQSARTGASREGWIADLSADGMRARVAARCELGDEIPLSFRPPRWGRREELLVRGEVVRVSGADCGGERELGVRFVALPAPLRARLEASLVGSPPPLPRGGALATAWSGAAELVG